MRSISVSELRSVLTEETSLLDVREPSEFASGHVPGARLVPLASVPGAVPDLPSDQPVYVICEVGGRSAQAALFLTRYGIDACNVDGGTQAWAAAGYPLEQP